MSSLIIFDPFQTPSPVLSFIPSNVDPTIYIGQNNALIDANLTTVAGSPQKYWKVANSLVVLMTAQEQSAVDAAIESIRLASQRSGATSFMTSQDDFGTCIRATGGVLVDEVNVIREWFTSFQAQVALATTLADLKTRVAGLPAMPDRTLSQFKSAIQTKVNSGVVDS